MTPEQAMRRAEALRRIYEAMEDQVFINIARTLKTPGNVSSDRVYQWRIERLSDLNTLNGKVVREIRKASGLADDQIDKVIQEVGQDVIKDIDNRLKSVALVGEPAYLDDIVKVFADRAKNGYSNMIQQSLITNSYGNGQVQQVYERILEETTARVLSGKMTINQAATRTVIKWGQTGFKSNFVDRAGRQWNATTYADTVLKTAVNNTYNDLRTARMSDYGVDLVLVNSYPDAREACSKIQGGIASMSNPTSDSRYPSIYEFGYGKPEGIRGVNCRHILYPFIPGVNTNNQPQYNPEEAQERAKIVQGQRTIERQIRKHKRSLSIAEEMGDQDVINEYKARIRTRQAAMRQYISTHELPRRYDRERMY